MKNVHMLHQIHGKVQLSNNVLKFACVIFSIILLAGCNSHYKQRSAAMEPAIMPGDILVVDTAKREPRRWQIIIFKIPGYNAPVVSRVVGTPGEKILIKNNKILINNIPQIPPDNVKYKNLSNVNAKFATKEPLYLKSNEYFVVGDNTENSNDSRFWGVLKAERIIGVLQTDKKNTP